MRRTDLAEARTGEGGFQGTAACPRGAPFPPGDLFAAEPAADGFVEPFWKKINNGRPEEPRMKDRLC
ncbi:MAG: hypothetical protein A2Z83_03615 [Omnitrophica bacterium GWA2_52_8]|nr:MAG: hypothetical protein A2Z83_03615 [Omnitrophica bacterium GWA2_52_8]